MEAQVEAPSPLGPLTGYVFVSLGTEETPASSGASTRTSSWLESSWLQPGTALANALRGFLTNRPLHHQGSNFLHGLQLHQDYCCQKHFSTWAGGATKLGPVVGGAG